MNDIYTDMIIPQLGDPNFQALFENFCNSIIQNIQRLISVQYTKGEPGNSVYTQKYTVDEGSAMSDELSPLTIAMMRKIFNDDTHEPLVTRKDLHKMLTGEIGPIQVGQTNYVVGGDAPSIIVDGVEYNAVPDLLTLVDDEYQGLNIEINVDDVKGEAYLASPYLFIDGRIAGLNKIFREVFDEEYYKTFHDFSVAVYGKGVYDDPVNQDENDPTTWNWTFELVNMVPKLYFDDNINEFCWNVNGQQTGITAQGVKGDNGITPNIIIAVCNGTPDNGKLTIDRIQWCDEEGNQKWARINANTPEPEDKWQENWIFKFLGNDPDNDKILQPKSNDLAIVFYGVGTPSQEDPNYYAYKNAYVGSVYIGETGPFVVIGYDGDAHTDIFESIREHDHWSLMMRINENITGSPRGYVLPADPEPHNTGAELANKTHIIYAEKGQGSQDDAGWARLHSAPVDSQYTKQGQQGNPPTDHVGDWQVDYNMNVQGGISTQRDLHVQGDATVQRNLQVQGTASIQGDTQVQGDLRVQGAVTSSDFTVIGRPWFTEIIDPKLACMSRFKNVSYTLRRTVSDIQSGTLASQTHNFKYEYQLFISGVLEMNIGQMSVYNHDNINIPHDILQEYTGCWSGGEHDQSYRNEYANLPAKQASKLYNVVKYEIPFSLVKSVSQTLNAVTTPDKNPTMWGFGVVHDHTDYSTQGNPVVKANTIQNFSDIGLRTGVTGFNENNRDAGSTISVNKDINGALVRNVAWNRILGITIQGDSMYYDGVQGQGAVNCLVQLLGDPTQGIDTGNYSVSGKLHYAPAGDIEINYCFDLFTRILETDQSIWKKIENTDSVSYKCNRINYNILLNITPVGCIQARHNGYNYMAPIWNAVNVGDIESTTIYYDQILTREKQSAVINPMISNTCRFAGTRDNTLQSTINGPTGDIISSGVDKSQYILGIFDRKTEDGIEGITLPNISTKFFDLTNNMRIVSNNVKVCPNNIQDGSCEMAGVSGNESMGWVSFKEVPVVVIPREGNIEDRDMDGKVKIGCGNIQDHAISVQGMLVYPYTSCLIMLDDEGNAFEVNDLYNDAQGNAPAGYHFISTGRMMGVTNGEVSGMSTRVSVDEQLPSDWDDDSTIPEDEETEEADPITSDDETQGSQGGTVNITPIGEHDIN